MDRYDENTIVKNIVVGQGGKQEELVRRKKLQKLMLRTREFLEIQTAWDLHGFKNGQRRNIPLRVFVNYWNSSIFSGSLSFSLYYTSYVKISFGYFSSNAKESIKPKLSRQKC